ncbi:MAG TPA: helix-turn-helix domain-containing protein, partial [Pseudonocardiaceae bacterium]|nr:helix-turn-helix domain-containing protein [Pseudonocardiaceae bacterium]
MDAHEARTVGALLRKIRFDRDLSLEVVAGRAGISAGFLSRVERGEAALERLSHWRGIADALGIALSEILRLPVPAPGNGHTDSSVVAVRGALDEVILGSPRGDVLPTETLRARVAAIHGDNRACRFPEVASALPGLIRDLHTTLAVGRDGDVLLPLAVFLHVQVTRLWLRYAAAPIDLRRHVVFLARGLARESNAITTLGVAAYGVADTLIADGA